MNTLNKKVSVIMPAFNEEARIVHSIEETARTFIEFGWEWELIVMDDGSSDRTYEKAAECSRKDPAHIFAKRNTHNRGKGRALKKAFHYVTGDYTVFLDGDLDLHPEQISVFFDIMQLDSADVVIGSKRHPNSRVSYPWYRKIISNVYYYLVKALFGLPCRDTQTGLKLFKTEVLRAVFPRILVKKFAFDIELLANIHSLGYKITSAPVLINPDIHFGLIRPRTIVRTMWDTLAIFYRLRIVRYYDRIDYHRRKNLAKEFKRLRK